METTNQASSTVSRRELRKLGRKKRQSKLLTDKEFAKAYFAGKSKRANDKKSVFRRKKTRKK
jgi:hypothetical protein